MEAKEAFDRLVKVSEKLLYETERLRRDVAIVNGRIIAHESERDDIFSDPLPEKPLPRKKVNIVDAINEIDHARRHVHACEIELSAIRARLDDIAENQAAREEMRPFIKR